jgi:hypothetical protein
MGSVRERLERERRSQEPPETIVTRDHRVALGASGPTMSTRQREQLAADQSEIVEASPYTRTGGTDFMSGNMSRVRDRQVATEAMKPSPPRPKTESELAGEAGLAMRERWAAEAKANEQAKIAARQKREADENATRERKTKQAQVTFQENTVMHECSDLSPAESQLFWERLAAMNATLDAGAASIVAEEIRSARK